VQHTRRFNRIYCVSLSFVATDHILALLATERNKITKAIEALQGPNKQKGRPPGSGRKAVMRSVEQDSRPPATVGPTAPFKKGGLTADGRKALSIAMKKR
jgi:hypothetical protein